jgi:hypothetical protein
MFQDLPKYKVPMVAKNINIMDTTYEKMDKQFFWVFSATKKRKSSSKPKKTPHNINNINFIGALLYCVKIIVYLLSHTVFPDHMLLKQE